MNNKDFDFYQLIANTAVFGILLLLFASFYKHLTGALDGLLLQN